MAELTGPDVSSDRLGAGVLAELVDEFVRAREARPWSRDTSFAWDRLEPERLSEAERSAVSFITVIEDHLPGYFAEYNRFFPLDESVSEPVYVHNRELYRFTVRWAQEEDAHADLLFHYQVRAGLRGADELRRELAAEGRKRFAFPYTLPVQVFTYTVIQEKATQLYYQQLAGTVTEPVLKSVLTHLARDEARHFAFFARMMEAYVQKYGDEILPAVKDVLSTFKMPLADTIRGYWRWAFRVADAAGGYDHTAAYEDLARIVERSAEVAPRSKAHDLVQFVRAVRAL